MYDIHTYEYIHTYVCHTYRADSEVSAPSVYNVSPLRHLSTMYVSNATEDELIN